MSCCDQDRRRELAGQDSPELALAQAECPQPAQGLRPRAGLARGGHHHAEQREEQEQRRGGHRQPHQARSEWCAAACGEGVGVQHDGSAVPDLRSDGRGGPGADRPHEVRVRRTSCPCVGVGVHHDHRIERTLHPGCRAHDRQRHHDVVGLANREIGPEPGGPAEQQRRYSLARSFQAAQLWRVRKGTRGQQPFVGGCVDDDQSYRVGAPRRRDPEPVLDATGDGRADARRLGDRAGKVGGGALRCGSRPGIAAHALKRASRLSALLGAGQRDGEAELGDREDDDEQR